MDCRDWSCLGRRSAWVLRTWTFLMTGVVVTRAGGALADGPARPDTGCVWGQTWGGSSRLRWGRDSVFGVVGQGLPPGTRIRVGLAAPLRAPRGRRSAPTECGGLHRCMAGCYTYKKCASTGGGLGPGGRALVQGDAPKVGRTASWLPEPHLGRCDPGGPLERPVPLGRSGPGPVRVPISAQKRPCN